MSNEITRRSFFMICWENLLQLMGLNLMFLVCCVPLVTIPAAAVGLSWACRCCLVGQGHLFREYVRAFRGALARALPAGLLLAAVLAGFAYGTVFYAANSGGSVLWMACAIFCMIAFYLVFCAAAYAFQLLAAAPGGTLPALRDAARLTLQAPRLLFTWLALAFAVPAAAVWFFPYTFPLLTLLVFSLSAMLAARGVVPVLAENCERMTRDE